MKLDLHRQIHRDLQGRRVITVEGFYVCMSAWRQISGVSEATFHRFQRLATMEVQTQPRGNTGMRKPRKHTSQAIATLKCILEKSADHMPHRTRTLHSGEKVVSMVLPAIFKWKEIIPEINSVNAAFGLKEVSPSNVSKIWKDNFSQFDAKRPGDNFARCSTCDRYQSQRKIYIAGSHESLMWRMKLDKHLNVAKAHRELYYANRYRPSSYPHECLTIMHNKMDHAKTASPVFSHKSKELDGLMKLPVSATDMIAHGHGDVHYAHYGLDIFSHDSNYTIGSFAKLLRDLELSPKFSSRELFVGSKSVPLFAAVLEGAELYTSSLRPPPEEPISSVVLPPILNVQMDNASGDNKNRYVFCFWSLLVARRVFREIYVNFMLVGHTHDDIDALFGRWSMLLRKDNFSTLPLLMKSFMELESIPTILHLVEEVPDFKGFIESFIAQEDESLVGHTKVQQFKFYVDSSGCPVMKYKLLCIDLDWLPKDSVGIKLWREDAVGQSTWPRGEPLPVIQVPMRSLDEIMKGISGFIKYWETMCDEDRTGEFRRRYEHVVFYWRAVKGAMTVDVEPSLLLRDGFRPTMRIPVVNEDVIFEDGDMREEYAVDDPFIGQVRDRPLPSFRVGRDVFEGYFVVVRPADGDQRPVWIARALSNPHSDVEQPNCILIQYFRPSSRDQEIQQNYTRWNSARDLRWKVDESQTPV